MATRLKARNIPKAKLKSVGYHGEPSGEITILENGSYNVKPYATAIVQTPQPEGNIDLTENNTEYNVSTFRIATTKIPMQENKDVTPSTQEIVVIPDDEYAGLQQVTVAPAPLEEKTITPETVQRTYTPTAPSVGFSSVTVSEPSEAIKNANLDAYIQGDLTDIVTSATKIAKCIFTRTNIMSISMPNVEEIQAEAFSYCANLVINSLPDSITTIGNSAFQNTPNIQLDKLPDNLVNLGNYSFSGCTGLTVSAIPNGITAIGAAAFYGCTGITTVEFPPNLREIPYFSFYNCTNLLTVDMTKVINIPTLTLSAFDNTTCTFLFRDQTQLDEYASATNWSTYADRFQIKGA